MKSWQAAACMAVMAPVGASSTAARGSGLPVSGALYVANCEQEPSSFLCRQFLMKFAPAAPAGVRTIELPTVEQPIRARDRVYKAAAVDDRARIAYLAAGCTESLIVTDLVGGAASIVRTPGIPCLQALVVDQARGGVYALGGTPTTIDSLVHVAPNGAVSVVADLRRQVRRDVSYVHPFKELVSFDSARRELMTPVLLNGDPRGERLLLAINVDTGGARTSAWIPGVQSQFYDAQSRSTVAYDCRVPDFVRVDSFEPLRFSSLFEISLAGLGAPTRCTDSFTGADFDPSSRRNFILFRDGRDFLIQISDLDRRLDLGWFATDATAATFHLPPRSLETTFFSVQFVAE